MSLNINSEANFFFDLSYFIISGFDHRGSRKDTFIAILCLFYKIPQVSSTDVWLLLA